MHSCYKKQKWNQTTVETMAKRFLHLNKNKRRQKKIQLQKKPVVHARVCVCPRCYINKQKKTIVLEKTKRFKYIYISPLCQQKSHCSTKPRAHRQSPPATKKTSFSTIDFGWVELWQAMFVFFGSNSSKQITPLNNSKISSGRAKMFFWFGDSQWRPGTTTLAINQL